LIGATFAAVAQNEGQVLGEVRALLPNANIYVMGYHNPYGGTPDHPFYAISAPAVQGLNSVISQIAVPFGATYVDFYTPILGRERELTFIDTWQTDPINNVHLNDQGYQVVSQQLIDASRPVPAPPSVYLAVIAILLLLLSRTRLCYAARTQE
jgi:lysophospholipase L1-like esterase